MRLNFGCGAYKLAGYTNIDADPEVDADVHAEALEFLDRLTAGEVAEIYAGHFLEHLERPAGLRFLQECYRVLAPGGICGIVVPDTREVLKRYVNLSIEALNFENRLWYFSDLDDVCDWILYSTVQPSRHLWAYDEFTLRRIMQEAGFTDLARIDRYRDPRLADGAFFQCGYQGVKA
jgi:hypothetical protein